MTPDVWDKSADPDGMLGALRDGGMWSERKLRLFAVARCRCVWDLLTDRRSREAVEVAERYADGLSDLAALTAAATTAQVAYAEAQDRWVHRLPTYATEPDPWQAAWHCAHQRGPAWVHRSALAAVLRDLLGNPFWPWPRPSAPVLAWDGGTVVNLAQTAYNERLQPGGQLDPQRLGILADALEEGGYGDAELLEHLRSPGPHWRGCWAVDLVLARE